MHSVGGDGSVRVGYVKLTPNWMKPLEEAHREERKLKASRGCGAVRGVVQQFLRPHNTTKHIRKEGKYKYI
jgi:hypothetical protein